MPDLTSRCRTTKAGVADEHGRPARIGTTHLGGCPQTGQLGVCMSSP